MYNFCCYFASVEESDGSFFESFTALSWKRENRRMSAVRTAETRAEQQPVDEKETLKEDEIETVNEREQLYVDVLYTIANCVGCQQQQGGQVRLCNKIYYPQQNSNSLFRLNSLHTSRMRCIRQHNVLSAFHRIAIIDWFMQLLRKSPK